MAAAANFMSVCRAEAVLPTAGQSHPRQNRVAMSGRTVGHVADAHSVYNIEFELPAALVKYDCADITAFPQPMQVASKAHLFDSKRSINTLAMSAARESLGVSCDDGSAHVLSLATPQSPLRFSLAPPAPLERGWSSMVFDPSKASHTAHLHEWDRHVRLYEADRATASFSLKQFPSAVTFANAPDATTLLAVCEGRSVSLWDPRTASACLSTTSVSIEPLLCAHAHNTTIAVAGTERTVYFLDTRKMRPLGSWRAALKYEVSWVRLLRDGRVVAGSGFDAELAVAHWNGSAVAKSVSMHSEARWAGLACESDAADVLGFTAAGSAYVVTDFGAGQLSPIAVEESHKRKGPTTDTQTTKRSREDGSL
eukprot:m.244542 g.244542  ORF g.244542 m.244542 type:complete len:367 (-) comp31546_c0_seq1:141-1241(-)